LSKNKNEDQVHLTSLRKLSDEKQDHWKIALRKMEYFLTAKKMQKNIFLRYVIMTLLNKSVGEISRAEIRFQGTKLIKIGGFLF
jgi:hypothetical protein